jgi:hypothetical protein
MGLRTPGTTPAPKSASQHAPEGLSGSDLSDFDNAFGEMFIEDEEEAAVKNRFDTQTLDEPEEVDGEQDEEEDAEPAVETKPAEKDPLESLEENQRAARDKWKIQKENRELKERLERLEKQVASPENKGNPLKGKTRDEIVDIAMQAMEEDGDSPEEAEAKIKSMTPAEIIKAAKDELRKEMLDEQTKKEESEKTTKAVDTFKTKIIDTVKSKESEFPTLLALGGVDAVYQMIEDDYSKNLEEFGSEYAAKNLMKIETAAKKVNDTLASEVKKALQSKHMRKFILDLAKEGGIENERSNNQSQEEFQLEENDPSTLTNNVHRRVTDPKDIRHLTEEEALEQSFAYLNT